MRDGRTRKLEVHGSPRSGAFSDFAEAWQVSLVVLDGGISGSEYSIEEPRVVLGRGPEADLCVDDRAMSKEHAVLEFSDHGYRVRDLGSMNGTLLNGSEVRVAELKHGDRLQLGEHVFQFVLEKKRRSPKTYVLPDS